jgi:hypothetical protein
MKSWERRRRESLEKLNDPNTADNMQVRAALVARMNAGEITLPQLQAELAAIKRAGRKAGRPVWGSR